MGDINPCPKLVEAILSPAKDTGPKQVLDAGTLSSQDRRLVQLTFSKGCGTGIWFVSISLLFIISLFD